MTLTKDTMKKGGRYNWKGQPERLFYIGHNWSGNGYWHQSCKVDEPDVVWCETLDSELHMLEETGAELCAGLLKVEHKFVGPNGLCRDQPEDDFFSLEAAAQHGFEMIDDDGDVFVCNAIQIANLLRPIKQAARQAAEPKPGLSYPREKFTPEQWAWCQRYEQWTSYEPLMDDFLAGNQLFYEAAQFSLQWFQDHSTDAYLRASDGPIPGDPDTEE